MEVSRALREHRALLVVAALVLPLAVCAVLSVWRDEIASATAVLVLALLVVAAAATGDRLVGVVAALSSGVWFDYFLTAPYHRFTIADRDDVEATVLLVVVGLAVSECALWGRREQARASRRASYLDGLLSMAEIILIPHRSADTVMKAVSARIVEVLDIERCRYVAGPVRDQRLATMDHDGGVVRGTQRLDVDRRGLPTDEETALPVLRDGQTLGYFVLTASSRIARPSLEQRRVAVLLADQVASVVGHAPEARTS